MNNFPHLSANDVNEIARLIRDLEMFEICEDEVFAYIIALPSEVAA